MRFNLTKEEMHDHLKVKKAALISIAINVLEIVAGIVMLTLVRRMLLGGVEESIVRMVSLLCFTIVGWGALTDIGAFLHFQLFQATITLQFFFTAMAGLLLGAKLGALSQLLYVVLGLVGVPIFAAGGGFGYVFNPTFGFLLGLIPTAWVIGKIAEKDRSVPRLLLACFAGLAVLYLVGLPYIALIVNVYKGGNVSGMTLATAYMLPYLPGDCLKIVVSVILAPRILKAMERNS